MLSLSLSVLKRSARLISRPNHFPILNSFSIQSFADSPIDIPATFRKKVDKSGDDPRSIFGEDGEVGDEWSEMGTGNLCEDLPEIISEFEKDIQDEDYKVI